MQSHISSPSPVAGLPPSPDLALTMNTMSSSRDLATDQTGSSNDLARVKPTWSSDFWWLLAVGLITVALCLPFIRYVGWLFDEGVFLHGAERMLRGDKLYLDFFEFLPPGG